MKKENKKQSFGKMRTREMIGYGFTDMAGNLLYVTFTTYIMYFYTNVMHMPAKGAWSAGIVLLVARIINALLSIVWGSIIDHTKTRWGQSRPWFLILAGPFVVTTWLCFLAPDLGGSTVGNFFFAMLTYIFASGFVYTGLAAAMSAVLPNLTNNKYEQAKASSWRMVGGSLGSFITCMVTPLFLSGIASAMFGWAATDKNPFPTSRYVWWIVIAVWAVMAGMMLVSAFIFMRERNFDPNKKTLSIKKSFGALKGNAAWYILVSAFVILWVAQSTRNGTALYYAQYILKNPNLSSAINGIQVLGLVTAILTPFILKALKKKMKFPKTLTLLMALAVAALGQAGMILKDAVPSAAGSLGVFFTFWTIGVFGAQLAMGMFFLMIADTVDYGEWKTGIRAPGLLASVGSSFSIQLGSAFGAYVPLEIMGAAGFDGSKSVEYNQCAAGAIKFVFIWLPVIVYAICAAIMIFYIKFEKKEDMIVAELAKRSKKSKIVNLAKK